MKKFLIGTMIIGLASLGYSQNANRTMNEVRLSDVTITPLNIDYIEKVREGTVSKRVFTLEKKASRYNITESPFFNPRGLSKINFAQKKGKILATYTGNGKIVSTSERYKDLLLPIAVRNAIYKGHPGWTMYGNAYLISYHHKKGVKKFYKIRIRRDNLTMNLRFDIDGNRI